MNNIVDLIDQLKYLLREQNEQREEVQDAILEIRDLSDQINDLAFEADKVLDKITLKEREVKNLINDIEREIE